MSNLESLLIVEDRPIERMTLSRFASGLGFECEVASSPFEARELWMRREWDFALVDLHLERSQGDRSGLPLIREFRQERPASIILALSADPRSAACHEATRMGASLFLRKPVLCHEELRAALEMARHRKFFMPGETHRGDDGTHTDPGLPPSADEPLVEASTRMLVKRAARAPHLPTIVCGEGGTGRDTIARLIHAERALREGPVPFVRVDCAAADEATLSHRLFGGRSRPEQDSPGVVSLGALTLASGGILYLDGLESLPWSVQERLARAIADTEFGRPGDDKPMPYCVQLVCSLTESRDRALVSGRLCPALHARILGPEIPLLPLRMRLFEMRTLVRLLLARQAVSLPEEVLDALVEKCKGYHWQGNLRELSGVLDLWLLVGSKNGFQPTVEAFPEVVTMFPPRADSVEAGTAGLEGTDEAADVAIQCTLQLARDAMRRDLPIYETLAELERRILASAIQRHRGNMSQVCHALRLPRSTLMLKRRQYGLP